jgi:hypothetical protein
MKADGLCERCDDEVHDLRDRCRICGDVCESGLRYVCKDCGEDLHDDGANMIGEDSEGGDLDARRGGAV